MDPCRFCKSTTDAHTESCIYGSAWSEFYKMRANPRLVRDDLQIKYGADHHDRRNASDIAGELARICESATEDKPEALVEFLDREFFWGAWKEIVERLPYDGTKFLANMRGLILAAYQAGRGAKP